jgi:hypothetical protein
MRHLHIRPLDFLSWPKCPPRPDDAPPRRSEDVRIRAGFGHVRARTRGANSRNHGVRRSWKRDRANCSKLTHLAAYMRRSRSICERGAPHSDADSTAQHSAAMGPARHGSARDGTARQEAGRGGNPASRDRASGNRTSENRADRERTAPAFRPRPQWRCRVPPGIGPCSEADEEVVPP